MSSADITLEQAALSDAVTQLVKLIKHTEMWGVGLQGRDCNHIPYRIVMEKFLRANGNDVGKASEHFEKVLHWRRQVEPRRALATVYKTELFRGKGNISSHVRPAKPNAFILWNRYGFPEKTPETFRDIMA